MSGKTKDTFRKILLIALSALTLSMVCISIFNYKDNEQKRCYLDTEKTLVQEELKEIIKSYDYLNKEHIISKNTALKEKEKIQKLLVEINNKALDYKSILQYRKQLLRFRKHNLELQKKRTNSDKSTSTIINSVQH